MTVHTLKRILYVEDEADIREVAKLALEAVGGFEVQVCDGGERALSVAPDFSPDLILLDVMMPDMDGPSTLTALRAIPQIAKIPIIFMTAKVQPHEIANYKKMGAIDVISKPFDPMTLAESVQNIWKSYGDRA